ncbi:hypothetical protein BU626_07780 [Staphylococcus capitis]|nr:hypothetical protein BU626_07780 [Staphylococcus capitis]
MCNKAKIKNIATISYIISNTALLCILIATVEPIWILEPYKAINKGEMTYLKNIVKLIIVIPKLLNIYLLNEGNTTNKNTNPNGKSTRLFGICFVLTISNMIVIIDKIITNNL